MALACVLWGPPGETPLCSSPFSSNSQSQGPENRPSATDSSPPQANYPGTFPLREEAHKGSRSGYLYPQLPSRPGCEAGGGVRSGAGRKAKRSTFLENC